jgi:hypothetical protein
MEDLLEHSGEIMSQVNDNPAELTAYEILLVYRRLVISNFRNSLQKHDVSHWSDFLNELLLVQKEHNSEIFKESKAALTQAFVFYLSSWKRTCSIQTCMTFDRTYFHESLMTEFSQVVERYYDVDTEELKTALKIIESSIYSIVAQGHASMVPFTTTLLTYVKITPILKRLTRFWSDEERCHIMHRLLDTFVRSDCYGGLGPYYVENFVRCLHFTPERLFSKGCAEQPTLLLRVGYEIQSDFLANVIQECIERFTDGAMMFCRTILEHGELWTATALTIFEAKIMSGLINRSPQLSNKLAFKLATCDADMPSLRGVLLLRPDQANVVLHDAVKQYVERFTKPMERMLKDIDSKVEWNLVVDFIRSSDSLSPEKWLGMICKRDTEGFLPEGIVAVTALLDKDRSLVNKRFLGWLARAMSRLTRRFSEDLILSDSTLKAVRDLGT